MRLSVSVPLFVPSFVPFILSSLRPREGRREGGRSREAACPRMIYSFIIPVLMPLPPSLSLKAAFLPSLPPHSALLYTRCFKVGDNDAITAITRVGRVELVELHSKAFSLHFLHTTISLMNILFEIGTLL